MWTPRGNYLPFAGGTEPRRFWTAATAGPQGLFPGLYWGDFGGSPVGTPVGGWPGALCTAFPGG
jgi:hypothetical protein